MFAGSRSRLLKLSVILLAGASLAGCHKKSPEKATPTKAVVKKSPEEIQREANAARQSLEGLKAPISELTGKFQALHKEYDPLPPALPGFNETRQKFYSAAEGLGMMSAKIPWLAGRIDSAVKAGDGEEMADISKDIARTYDEIRQVDKISIELLHEIQPFRQTVEELNAKGPNKCD